MNALPERMRAILITEPGGPEVLQEDTADVPRPGPEDVLIKVEAAGVNRPDCLQRSGNYPVPPDASPLPGLEVAGEVIARGAKVSRWAEGDRVVALCHGGGYAEYCRADAGHCLPWPDGLSAAEAAGLPETCFTVHHNLVERGLAQAGERVLIHGGSSGIGSTAIQVARALDMAVIVTAGTQEKCAYCLELGANHAINYRTQAWEEVVSDITGGAGVNVVLDMVAGPYVAKNLALLAEDGRYVMIAFLLGPKAEVNFGYLLRNRLIMTGSTLRPQSVEAKRRIATGVESTLWPMISQGQLKSPVYRVFDLAQAREAHALMESSEHMGKIVLSLT